jgi:hypothetical protein
MRQQHIHTEPIRVDNHLVTTQDGQRQGLPGRLLTAFEVAAFIGCHEETVRRAYWRGLLRSQRFGVRGRRFIQMTSSTGCVEARRPRTSDKTRRSAWPSCDDAGAVARTRNAVWNTCGST